MSLNIGDKIPEFELYNHDKTKHSDKDFLGQKTMFVFMPFPFSSVCDKEFCGALHIWLAERHSPVQ